MAKKKKEKKKKGGEEEELQEGQQGKKGKKKLLLIPLALILVAAIAAAAVLFVLPRFGIDLLGGSEPGPGEEEPPKNLEVFIAGEPIQSEEGGEEVQDATISLDTLLEEGEGELIARRSPEKPKGDESSNVDTRYTYIYELTNPAEVMNRYLDAVLGGEQGFSLVGEDYVILDEQRPELQDAEGVLILARPSVVEGHIFQLVIGWSQASANLAVRVSAPEGAVTKPEPEPEPEPTSVSEQMEQLRSMTPAELGLAGTSMDNYTIFPVDGFVTVNGQECRRFNLYPQGDTGSIAGTYFLSTDKQHVYVLDPNTNTVSTIR